jgi:hypothetical protein
MPLPSQALAASENEKLHSVNLIRFVALQPSKHQQPSLSGTPSTRPATSISCLSLGGVGGLVIRFFGSFPCETKNELYDFIKYLVSGCRLFGITAAVYSQVYQVRIHSPNRQSD